MRRSHDAILVLNAGSSSIKLSVFAERAGALALEVRGGVEGLYAAPRFVAQDPSGHVVTEDVLVEDLPDPEEGEQPPASPALATLGLPGRRGLPRIAIIQIDCHDCAYEHGVDKPEIDQ